MLSLSAYMDKDDLIALEKCHPRKIKNILKFYNLASQIASLVRYYV